MPSVTRTIWIGLAFMGALAMAAPAAPAAGTEPVYKKARSRRPLPPPPPTGAYVYTSEGKTDPFAAFTLKDAKSPADLRLDRGERRDTAELTRLQRILEKLREPKTELQRIDLDRLTLTSLIRTPDKVLAMVSDPTGKGYVLEEGTSIGTNGGVVETIVCDERRTLFGLDAIRKVVIKEPYISAEQKIAYKSFDLEMPGLAYP